MAKLRKTMTPEAAAAKAAEMYNDPSNVRPIGAGNVTRRLASKVVVLQEHELPLLTPGELPLSKLFESLRTFPPKAATLLPLQQQPAAAATGTGTTDTPGADFCIAK